MLLKALGDLALAVAPEGDEPGLVVLLVFREQEMGEVFGNGGNRFDVF